MPFSEHFYRLKIAQISMETILDIISYLETLLTPEGQPDPDILQYVQALLCDYRENYRASPEMTEKITSLENWVGMLSPKRESYREVLTIKAMIITECQSLKRIMNQVLEILNS